MGRTMSGPEAKIRAVAFDAYGTIFDTGTGSVDATARILKKNRSNLEPRVIYREWKREHIRLIASLSGFETEEQIFGKGLGEIYRRYGSRVSGRRCENYARHPWEANGLS